MSDVDDYAFMLSTAHRALCDVEDAALDAGDPDGAFAISVARRVLAAVIDDTFHNRGDLHS